MKDLEAELCLHIPPGLAWGGGCSLELPLALGAFPAAQPHTPNLGLYSNNLCEKGAHFPPPHCAKKEN